MNSEEHQRHDPQHRGPAAEVMTEADLAVREQISQVIASLEDLLREELESQKPERAAQICERLAEDLAEVAAMIRALPGTAVCGPGYTYAAVAAVATGVRGEPDPIAWLIGVLSEAAVRLGCTRAPEAGRACWEAACALGILTGASAVGADGAHQEPIETGPGTA